MKAWLKPLLLGISGCLLLTLILGYGLSVAVNFGIAQLENQGSDFLPQSETEVGRQTPP